MFHKDWTRQRTTKYTTNNIFVFRFLTICLMSNSYSGSLDHLLWQRSLGGDSWRLGMQLGFGPRYWGPYIWPESMGPANRIRTRGQCGKWICPIRVWLKAKRIGQQSTRDEAENTLTLDGNKGLQEKKNVDGSAQV